ncbi:MAG: hypothetical protein REH83_03690 [Rickettsiella sp.]|nr:hypothetical protein [Rickettsiella sp.]
MKGYNNERIKAMTIPRNLQTKGSDSNLIKEVTALIGQDRVGFS